MFIFQIVAHWVYRSVSYYPRNPCLLFLIVDLDSKSCSQAGLPFGVPLTFLLVCTPTPDSFKDDINPLLSSLFTTKVSSEHQFKNHIELFSTFFKLKLFKSDVKFEKENRQKPTYNFNCLFSRSPLVYRKIFTDDHYTSGYFPWTGTGLIGSPRMDTIASRDQWALCSWGHVTSIFLKIFYIMGYNLKNARNGKSISEIPKWQSLKSLALKNEIL